MKGYIEIKVKTWLGDIRRKTIPISTIKYVTENKKGNALIVTRFSAGMYGCLFGAENLPALHTETPYDEVIRQLNEVNLCKR